MDSLLNIFNFPVSYTITKTEIILLEKFLLKYFEKIGEERSKYVLQDVFEDMRPQDIINYIESQEFSFNDGNEDGNNRGEQEGVNDGETEMKSLDKRTPS